MSKIGAGISKGREVAGLYLLTYSISMLAQEHIPNSGELVLLWIFLLSALFGGPFCAFLMKSRGYTNFVSWLAGAVVGLFLGWLACLVTLFNPITSSPNLFNMSDFPALVLANAFELGLAVTGVLLIRSGRKGAI